MCFCSSPACVCFLCTLTTIVVSAFAKVVSPGLHVQVLLALIGWARGAMWSLEQPVNSVLCEHPAFQYLLQFYKDMSSVPGMACAGLHRGTVSLGNLGAESVKRVWIYTPKSSLAEYLMAVDDRSAETAEEKPSSSNSKSHGPVTYQHLCCLKSVSSTVTIPYMPARPTLVEPYTKVCGRQRRDQDMRWPRAEAQPMLPDDVSWLNISVLSRLRLTAHVFVVGVLYNMSEVCEGYCPLVEGSVPCLGEGRENPSV